MQVIAYRTLREFLSRYPDAIQPLKTWHKIVEKADWDSPNDVKSQVRSVSIVGNDRFVFNIGGNKYRLIVRIKFRCKLVLVRFLGTHAEYDRIKDIGSV